MTAKPQTIVLDAEGTKKVRDILAKNRPQTNCPQCYGTGARIIRVFGNVARHKCDRCDGTGKVPAPSVDDVWVERVEPHGRVSIDAVSARGVTYRRLTGPSRRVVTSSLQSFLRRFTYTWP